MSGDDYYGANQHHGPNGPGHYIPGEDDSSVADNWHPSVMGGPPPTSAQKLEYGVAEGASGTTIEAINLEITGEQPGNVDDRAGQFDKLANQLSTVSSDLRAQVEGLDANWESPSAKAAFLLRVGTTLMYLDDWQESASDSASALRGLAGVMRETQEEMADLWTRYETELADSRPDGSSGAYLPAKDGGNAEVNENVGKPTESETKEKYNQLAITLAKGAAADYLPYTQRIAGARGPKMTPLDGVFHPGAFGLPNLPGGPPGGAPGAPPGFGGAPPPAFGGGATTMAAPPPAAASAFSAPPPPPAFAGSAAPTGVAPPGFTGDTAPPPGALAPPGPSAMPAPPPGMTALTPNSLTGMPRPGGSPRPPGTLTGASTPPGFRAGGGAQNLGVLRSPGMTAPSSPTSLTGGAPGSTLGTPPGSGLNPGTGMPPGSGMPPGQQPNRNAAQRPGDGRGAPGAPALPPGAPGLPPNGTRQSTQDKSAPDGSAPAHRQQEAFLAPPGAPPPVLGARDRKQTRPGGFAEAPTAAASAPGTDAAPPVLVNQRLGPPRRTYTEQRAERRAAQRQRELDRRRGATPASEFVRGLPDDAPAVLAGRTEPARTEQPRLEAEVPAALRPSTAVPEVPLAPAVRADRSDRRVSAEPARKPAAVTDENAWEVSTPGGPVVSGSDSAAPARPDTAPVLGR
ncbi:WXG100 family type VII secretion target [Prauserella cavernicola]|uniref:PPE domain-containing protein n=1 Tax=Prauserella cavernicola TaxID=2800127 RepID=A0A934QMT8_9PSEU|nr:WXG100 family type VII secretion target [Prauserella cavernicola]MBK1783471.1 hypothetical protein [Prauserella cavernicola]